MPQYSYERLSAQDHSFLLFETANVPMHVASTQIFELGPLESADGGVDYAQIKRFIGSVLHRIPRYRQKLRAIPLEGSPVWIDDERFELDYHVRHTSLPRPGSDAQLRQLSARVMAQRLDRARPLWEIWVVEGLAGGRFALINKTHHSSYNGRVCWGFNADRELVPDLGSFVAAIESSLRRIADAAEVKLGSAPEI